VALQREGLFRRSKRLVVMDMDSTLIRIEVIDELARAHGVRDQVSAITERAMQGEMDYDESLRQRLALLAGLDVNVLKRLAAELPLTEGAETLIRVLKQLGYRTAVVSGGFSIAAEALKARLGIDYAYSNALEVVDGRLTGKVLGPIVNARRKAGCWSYRRPRAWCWTDHRRGGRSERPPDAGEGGAGHRLPSEEDAAGESRHLAVGHRPGRHPLSAGDQCRGTAGGDRPVRLTSQATASVSVRSCTSAQRVMLARAWRSANGAPSIFSATGASER
jgi:phosphoserine phosphatase SerB